MESDLTSRYFASYSGVTLPLNLVNPLDSIANRNTYFCASYDSAGLMVRCEKVVYGEIELRHQYHYSAEGRLTQAEISDEDGEVELLRFDENGKRQ
ncbi:MAG: hypothetical protein HQL48_09775 [Gammaproteobacteria bacterium]|nr:hypothetical protein [Gammaproteobacteria bacterium]